MFNTIKGIGGSIPGLYIHPPKKEKENAWNFGK